jgi:hypothetical protein
MAPRQRRLKSQRRQGRGQSLRKGLKMTTFDERENAYEAKFAHDEELRFKATARRDKALGLWAAAQLGLSDAAAEDYAKDLLRFDFKLGSERALIEKVLLDFNAKGLKLDELTLRKKLVEFMSKAIADIEAGK